jgi:hypothetical protein
VRYATAAQMGVLLWLGIGLWAETDRWEFLVACFAAIFFGIASLWSER